MMAVCDGAGEVDREEYYSREIHAASKSVSRWAVGEMALWSPHALLCNAVLASLAAAVLGIKE